MLCNVEHFNLQIQSFLIVAVCIFLSGRFEKMYRMYKKVTFVITILYLYQIYQQVVNANLLSSPFCQLFHMCMKFELC